MKFGEKVLHVMNLKRISPEELANRSGFSHSYIYSITNGNRQNPPLETIKRLAESLGVEPGYLINEKTIDLDTLAEISGVKLSSDMVKFISSQKNLPYLEMAKNIEESKIPVDTIRSMLNLLSDAIRK